MKALFILYALLSVFMAYYVCLGIPAPLLLKAGSQRGFYEVMANGSFNERHEYMKNRWTKYGRLGVDAETYLESQGWSSHKVHEVGYSHRLSKKR